jgi:hypothetical protein
MPQVAARITTDYENSLKALFRTKSAGAEFLLPWMLDAMDRCLRAMKSELGIAELKTIVEAYRKTTKLTPEHCRLDYFQLRMKEACKEDLMHTKHGASWPSLQRKIERFDDLHATTAVIWGVAFWQSPLSKEVSLDEYVK